MSIRDVKRHPCTSCGILARSVTGLCVDCRPERKAKRPERPCVDCDRKTTAKEGRCTDCRHRRANLHAVADPLLEDHALTGGSWVARPGGVWVWVTERDAA